MLACTPLLPAFNLENTTAWVVKWWAFSHSLTCAWPKLNVLPYGDLNGSIFEKYLVDLRNS